MNANTDSYIIIKLQIEQEIALFFNHIYQPLRSDRIIFKWSLTGLNSEFFFS